MTQLLTLSKAARLVGVKRDILQTQVRNGKLHTFEGLLNFDELVKLYPQTQLEDNSFLEKMSHYKNNAFHKLHHNIGNNNIDFLTKKIIDLKQSLQNEKQTTQALSKLLISLQSDFDNNIKIETKIQSQLIQQTLDATFAYKSSNAVIQPKNQFSTNLIHLLPSQTEFTADSIDTILDAALKAGTSLDYGCSDGSCGRCKVKIKSGSAKQARYHEYHLSEKEKAEGIVLSCAYSCMSNLEIESESAKSSQDIRAQTITAEIKSISHNSGVSIVRVKTPAKQRFRFLAGQSTRISFNQKSLNQVNLNNSQQTIFPIASCPCDDRIVQLHIPWQKNNYKNKLIDQLKIGGELCLTGPFGNFLLDVNSQNPIIFITYESEFSHLKSLIEQAISLDKTENLYLFWISRNNKALYLNNLCRAWSDAFDQFKYDPIIIDNRLNTKNDKQNNNAQFYIQTALDYIENTTKNLAIHDFYLALPDTMKDLSTQFLSARGIPSSNIRVSSF